VIAGRPAHGVGGGEKEQDAAFDEGLVVVGEGRAGELLLEPVGNAPAAELVLQAAVWRGRVGLLRHPGEEAE